MECPHCGAETLMGATTCFACRQSIFEAPGARPTQDRSAPPSRPAAYGSQAADTDARYDTSDPDRTPPGLDDPFGAERLPPPVAGIDAALDPSLPPPVELPTGRRRTLCKICFGPCSDPVTLVCDVCHDRSSAPRAPEGGVEGFGKKLGTSAFRPPPARRAPGAAARAARAALWGAVLVGAGFGVVRYTRPPEPGAGLARDTRAEPASVAFAVPRDPILRYRTTIDVRIVREEIPSAFDTEMMTIFDLHQIATHDAEVMLVREEREAAVLDVRTECRLDSQTGVWEQRDGSQRAVYPWPGRIEVERVRMRATGPLERTAGGEPLPARDVPPLLAFAHTGGPRGEMSSGTTWSTRALLPCLAARGGAITPTRFDCSLRYVGRRVLNGRDCAVLRLDATPLRELDEAFERLDGVGGRVSGALAYDTTSGLLVEADLLIDTNAHHGGSRPDERVGMRGRLTVSRD